MGEGGPDMSSSPPPIVAQIFGFFCFFWFSRWFCYAFGKDPLVFWVFSGFPKGFAIFVCRVCLVGTLQIITCITPEQMGDPYMSHSILQNTFDFVLIMEETHFMQSAIQKNCLKAVATGNHMYPHI